MQSLLGLFLGLTTPLLSFGADGAAVMGLGSWHTPGTEPGEFYFKPTSGPANNLGYSPFTRDQGTAGVGSFQTFCMEKSEGVRSPSDYTINDEAVGGGVNLNPPAGDQGGDVISQGTAWLYSQFAQGTLPGYDFTNASNRTASAELLQMAIWALEDEVGPFAVANNPFYAAALQHGGKTNGAMGLYGVFAVNNIGNSGTQLGQKGQDFLFYAQPSGTIGNFVWKDLNGNGIQDSGEPGIDGVTVQLKDTGGSVIDTEVTQLGGFYQFTGLTAGTYGVEVLAATLPPGFTPSPVGGGTPATDSNGSPTSVTLATNSSTDETIDFGYVPPPPTGKIGDFVWNDLNENGIQDNGEPGIDGVKVRVEDASQNVLANATTSGGGAYLFTGLAAGNYVVVIDTSSAPLSGLIPTIENAGGDPSKDSDTNSVAVTLVTDSSIDLDADFGFIPTPAGSIGDFVWEDLNGDGIQGAAADEPGIGGVIVILDGPGGIHLTTTTDPTGYYLFTGLPAGDYTVTVPSTVTVGGFVYAPTTPNAPGSTPTNDSNTIPTTTVNLPLNTSSDTSVDFGYTPVPAGQIGDFVWNDLNANGIQDNGEPGIENVPVYLLDTNDVTVQSTATGPNGEYLFTGLMAGSYKVKVDTASAALTGFIASPVNAGSDTTIDSNPNPGPVALPSNTASNLTIDFGYYQPSGRIGDFVWFDANENGVQDSGESGINGVTVKLFGPGNSLIDTKVTSGNGGYLFTGLNAGTYTVTIDNAQPALSGYIPTIPDAAGDDAADSDVTPVTVSLAAHDSEDLTVDFGFVPTPEGSIGNFVWKDTNGNGIQDATEPGIQGVAVNLYDSANALIDTLLTDIDGFYLFTGLTSGNYTVTVDLSSPALAGLTASAANQGGDPAADSNTNPSAVNLPLNTSTDLTIDFGFQPVVQPPTGRIGDFVWKDTNANGRQDAGEPGINGVTVTLKNSGGSVISTTVTAGNGGYLFTGLAAGTYSVEVDESDPDLASYMPTADNAAGSTQANDSNPNPWTVILATDSSEDLTVDFGFIPPGCGCIGNFVWKDLDCDGIQDYNEPGIRGVTVKLYWNGTLVATVVTDSCGRYQFKNLWAGCYSVVIDDSQAALAGLCPTKVNAGTNRCYDSNPNPAVVCLTAGIGACGCVCDSTIDFGYKACPPPRPLTTYTMGGWGACPSGNNPGMLLKNNWSAVYPGGCLIVGGNKTLKFTSSSAIMNFLPCGGTAAALSQSYINPTTRLGVLAGQVVALRLGVDFSNKGILANGLASAKFKSGKFAGQTVGWVLALSEAVLGGAPLPAGISYADLSDACTLVNENYDAGINKGNLIP